MSYHRINAIRERDPLVRENSPYGAPPPAQPTPTTCLPTAFDAAARSIGAAGLFLHEDLSDVVAPFVGTDGWDVLGFVEVVGRRHPELVLTPACGPRLVAAHDVAFIVLIPGEPIGHAVAVTRECSAGQVWDPWPPGAGQLRSLKSDEWKRWASTGCLAIAVRSR